MSLDIYQNAAKREELAQKAESKKQAQEQLDPPFPYVVIRFDPRPFGQIQSDQFS